MEHCISVEIIGNNNQIRSVSGTREMQEPVNRTILERVLKPWIGHYTTTT